MKDKFLLFRTYIGKEHGSEDSLFTVVNRDEDLIKLKLHNSNNFFTSEIKLNSEGEYCKVNKISIRSKHIR